MDSIAEFVGKILLAVALLALILWMLRDNKLLDEIYKHRSKTRLDWLVPSYYLLLITGKNLSDDGKVLRREYLRNGRWRVFYVITVWIGIVLYFLLSEWISA